jgi:hypothetical protein
MIRSGEKSNILIGNRIPDLVVCSIVPFIEPRISLHCWHEAVISLYPVPDESIPHPRIPFILGTFEYYLQFKSTIECPFFLIRKNPGKSALLFNILWQDPVSSVIVPTTAQDRLVTSCRLSATARSMYS